MEETFKYNNSHILKRIKTIELLRAEANNKPVCIVKGLTLHYNLFLFFEFPVSFNVFLQAIQAYLKKFKAEPERDVLEKIFYIMYRYAVKHHLLSVYKYSDYILNKGLR